MNKYMDTEWTMVYKREIIHISYAYYRHTKKRMVFNLP